MFPVPQHLPRSGGDHLSSTAGQDDPILDLLRPLLSSEAQSGPSSSNANQVKSVRQALEKAARDNKAKTHELVLANFPTISTHIQLSTELQSNVTEVQRKLSGLEKEIDHSDIKTSFLPPLISTLNSHFSATTSRSAAQAHTKALQALSKHADRLRKLESAVWMGQGAEDWVLDELDTKEGYAVSDEDLRQGEEFLRGTKIRKDIETKDNLLKSMVVEQITDGFHKAVSFSTPTSPQQGTTLSLQNRITLQHPKNSRPANIVGAPSSTSYHLSQIYLALSRLNLLEKLLQTLATRLLRDLIQPIVSNKRSVSLSSTEALSVLRLETPSSQSAKEALDGIKSILEFVSNIVFPPIAVPERDPFLFGVTSSTFRLVLEQLILPSLPPSLDSVPDWLEVLAHAANVETTLSPSTKIVQPFFESEAGLTWAQHRRYAVSDEVRRLVLSGWEGWEGTEKEQEKETIVYVEVEVEEGEPDVPIVIDEKQFEMKKDAEEEFGWGFNEEDQASQAKEQAQPIKPEPAAVGNSGDVDMVDDGWGFDETSTSSGAGPSSPPKPPGATKITDAEEEADGWDLDPSPKPTPAVEPVPTPKPAKPAREAKRLGKKVAKVKAEDDYDPWGSGTESAVESVTSSSSTSGLKLGRNGNGSSSGYSNPSNATRSPSPPPEVIPSVDPKKDEDDGWGWDDDAAATQANASADAAQIRIPPVQVKRKELKEERRIVKERYLVSNACESLVGIVQKVLADMEKLGADSSPSPSFASSSLDPILVEAVKDVFTLYRALLPAHFSKKLYDVPSLAMQAYNDCLHLSSLLSKLPISRSAVSDESAKLLALADHLFESQLEVQRNTLMEGLEQLDELRGTSDEKVFHNSERAVRGLVHNIESLARVIKPVLARSKALEILSYILTTLISSLTTYVIDLSDITEVESNRLTELFKLVYPLEHLFDEAGDGEMPTGGGVVVHVNGWLKFCYISEILQASLIDITYLLDSGSLVDFTSDELVGLVRALFASSEKRDGVVDRIERDGTGGHGAAV
ncbi:hypothetical protein I317_06287 [Kwoniella heveanensis CBS 569]|uniref:Retrograde transport protein Dsl1 C-terminal domain-containing protein n=1 Tax=Kwoniella heveanensis BCC8398 TaxID=1296120 RepID=A0A1B9GVL0_9TREE|nr:hypothetical protein I316_03492 [Kwoniella heveanensis BCC8398]OCF39913.1 hypothetical protein I317_06287 [Kwoniella heveanensis CBS 569]